MNLGSLVFTKRRRFRDICRSKTLEVDGRFNFILFCGPPEFRLEMRLQNFWAPLLHTKEWQYISSIESGPHENILRHATELKASNKSQASHRFYHPLPQNYNYLYKLAHVFPTKYEVLCHGWIGQSALLRSHYSNHGVAGGAVATDWSSRGFNQSASFRKGQQDWRKTPWNLGVLDR